jgi:hypothetical protein
VAYSFLPELIISPYLSEEEKNYVVGCSATIDHLLRRTLQRSVFLLSIVRQPALSIVEGLGSTFCNSLEQAWQVLSEAEVS